MRKILFLLSILAIFGCARKNACSDQACTMEFRAVTVEVSDSSNPDLAYVNTQTIVVSSGKIIHFQSEASTNPANSFTVVDDGDVHDFGYNTSTKVELKIFNNSVLVKTVPYVINVDCCHISRSEGPEKVVLK